MLNIYVKVKLLNYFFFCWGGGIIYKGDCSWEGEVSKLPQNIYNLS